MPTPVFLTGFEHGIISAAGTGLFGALSPTPPVITAVTAQVRNGDYAMSCPGSGAAGLRHIQTPVWTSSSVVVGRLAFKFTANPTVECSLIESSGLGGTAWFRMYLQTDGKMRAGWFGGTGGVQSITASALALNTWHLLEWRFDSTTTAATIDWQVNSVAQAQSTTTLTTAGGMTYHLIGQTDGGGNIGTAGQSISFDDICISTTAADYPLGDGKVIKLLPGSDGTHSVAANQFLPGDSGGTAYTNASTTAFQMVDDDPVVVPWTTTRSTTDNIRQAIVGTSNYIEIRPTATPESGTANGVRATLAYSSPSGAGTNLAGAIVRNSGGNPVVIYGDLAVGGGGLGGAGQDYDLQTNTFKGAMVAIPGAGWTPSEVNAIRFRIGGSNDIAPVPTWQALMLEADYPIVVASATKACPVRILNQSVKRASLF